MIVNTMRMRAIPSILKPSFGNFIGEIIASDTTTMIGKMYKILISRKARIKIKMVLAEAGRPTKNFSSLKK